MSRIFLSHSSANNAEAVALRDWLSDAGWDDIFLDTDPQRGIAAGELWERALNQAANRCEAVLFLVSRAWLNSSWCLKEFNLAHRLNKRLFGVLIEDLAIADLPVNLTTTWQMVRLAAGHDHVMLRATMPVTGEETHVTFSAEGLARLKTGLQRAGLDPRFFAWPPQHDPNRPPYRGLLPLEAEDAGIFFGRDAPLVEAFDRLRGLRQAAPPRLLVILGASGAGKSSFLRAGLLPRLARDDRNFVPLPALRPQRAAINGETGLVRSLETALQATGRAWPRAEIRAAVEAGAPGIRPLLAELAAGTLVSQLADEPRELPPTFVLPIDQGEELFLTEGAAEADRLLVLIRDLLADDGPAVLTLITMRSDSYERLQSAKTLEDVAQATFSLRPMPRGAYQSVIEGPPARLRDTTRPLVIEPALTQALLADIETGGGRDALPLLAFILERLFLEYGGRGRLTLADYDALGRIKGSIEMAVERALTAADADSKIPRDRAARLLLLRRGLIPWLAGIDPETGSPRRRVARLSEIPAEARPLIDQLKEQRLLATDVAQDSGEVTIEPAHEALLRQWGLLQGWLAEDSALLAVLEGVKHASRDWSVNNQEAAWLTHATDRLAAAERLTARPDLAANLEPTDRNYLAACRTAEAYAKRGKRLVQAVIYVLLIGIIVGLVGWINQSTIKAQWRWYTITRRFMVANVQPYVLSGAAEQALKPAATFRECLAEQGKDYCPEMVAVPAGSFMMGAAPTETGFSGNESPQHQVTIAKPFAVSKFELTFDEWDTCVSDGDCTQDISDSGWGRGQQPAVNVTWNDAQLYVAWLSKMTGKPYRLLSEAEYEYAARGGTQTAYPWGDEIGKNNANCNDCGSKWNNRPAPVGSFAANGSGLYDMVGNIWEWVEDCRHNNYKGAPTDGSAWIAGGDCKLRVYRGGSWYVNHIGVRSAFRNWADPEVRSSSVGFRVGRTLEP
jgi:formylglycine-generating enzyme required for sulfatase activity